MLSQRSEFGAVTKFSARKKMDGSSDAILVIETKCPEVKFIGCFMAGIDLKTSSATTGTGESFVFTFRDKIQGHFWNESRPASLFANFTKSR